MKDATRIAVGRVVSGKAKADKEARANLKPGEYNIDTTVHITGKLTVGEDHTIAPTSSLLNKEFLVLVLNHAGITRKAAMSSIERVAEDYLVNWTGSKEDKEAAKVARKERVADFDPDGAVEAFFDGFKKTLPQIPSKGKVTWKGSAEEIIIEAPMEIEIGTIEEKVNEEVA